MEIVDDGNSRPLLLLVAVIVMCQCLLCKKQFPCDETTHSDMRDECDCNKKAGLHINSSSLICPLCGGRMDFDGEPKTDYCFFCGAKIVHLDNF